MGAGLGAVLFGAVSVYRSLLAEGSLLDYLGPIGMMTVIGGTVGGLVGPLIGQAWRRSRKRRRHRNQGGSDVGGGEVREGKEPAQASGRRQPFWFTLLVGIVVGWGVGTAWGRIWIGVGLGAVLALLARRAFR